MNKKQTFWKSLGLLALVIVLFTLLSRWMLNGGQTLADYAKDHHELAYGTTAADDTTPDSTTSDGTDSENSISDGSAPDAPGADISGNTGTDDQSGAAIPDDSLIGNGAGAEDRVTYQPDFYYEALSVELKAYITGKSYPNAENADPAGNHDTAESTGVTAEIGYDDLSYVHVLYVDFNGETKAGELICNRTIAEDLTEIFYELFTAEYQIEKIRLIDTYGGDDLASMADNNTSCFNYRPVAGSEKLSKHALGLAIDINPLYNPYVRYTAENGQLVSPAEGEAYADRSKEYPYKIDSSDLCCRLFLEHGFTWGGNWNSVKDYQHFQK